MKDELIDFAENAKFKTSGTNTYTYFTINNEKQIRIRNLGKYDHRGSKILRKYFVTLHSINDDNITYKEAEQEERVETLKEAKIVAAKYYFKTIREEI